VRAAIAALCLAVVGCSKLGPAPRLDSIEPSECSRDEACALVLRGAFEPPVKADLDTPSRSALGGFQVQLLSGDQVVVDLPAGAFRGPDRVETTLPAGAPEGVYLVRLTDPWGRSTSLADALRVRAGVLVPLPDGGSPDAGPPDAGSPDAGSPDRAPPLADFAITSARFGTGPAASSFGSSVSFDSSPSRDIQTPAAELQVSWSFAAPASAPPWTLWTTTTTAENSFRLVGLATVVLAVKDADGDIGYAERTLSIADGTRDVCVVTTGSSAKDGATSCSQGPAYYGSDGELSLDEALQISNSPSVSETIVLGKPMVLTGLPLYVDSGVQIVGAPGVRIEREIVAQNSPITLIGVEIAGPNGKLTVPNGTRVHLVDSAVHDSPGVVVSDGYLAVERTRFDRCTGGTCITINGPLQAAELVVSQSSFSGTGSGYGIDSQQCARSSGSYSMDLISNTFTGFATAIRVGMQCDRPTRIFHQTFHGNGVGIDYLGGAQHELRNNIFTAHSISAVQGCSVSFAARSDHLLDANASDGCIGGDATTLRRNPWYVSTTGGDFRLRYGSPAVDVAPATGLDVNGAAPGAYLGAGPDYGGRETY
jgi:hypothetical protein